MLDVLDLFDGGNQVTSDRVDHMSGAEIDELAEQVNGFYERWEPQAAALTPAPPLTVYPG